MICAIEVNLTAMLVSGDQIDGFGSGRQIPCNMSSDECGLECRASHSRTALCHQVQGETERCYTCDADDVEQQAGGVEDTADLWIQATEPVKGIGADGRRQCDMAGRMELQAGVRRAVVSSPRTVGCHTNIMNHEACRSSGFGMFSFLLKS